MAARSPAPPDTLAVLGQHVSIDVLDSSLLPDAYGSYEHDARRIELRDNMSPFDLRDTLLHELMHAIRACQGRPYGGKVEEDYVQSLATGLTAVFRQNPEFARWLINHPKT